MAKAKKKVPTKKAPTKKASASKKSAATTKKSAASPKKMAASATKSSSAGKAVNWEQFITPLDDRLIIEIASDERVTPGGLYIPDTIADISGNFKGKVLIAGRGHRDPKGRLHPMDVKPGDTILFADYAGSKLELLGKEVRILRESEVLGIVEKE